ncbi:WYL domain-containing protein [Radiobacillus sp. PE A8.2]|uniref:WYL domain-containing protein n=1 Tax=Radiobacillus sp. PE A8.2 TaxID=3380349 RepID=UPI00388DEAEC
MTAEQVKRYQYRTVEIIYVYSGGQWTKRKVKIIGYSNTQLYAFCYLRKANRSVNLSN